jgi:hypothetical protein
VWGSTVREASCRRLHNIFKSSRGLQAQADLRMSEAARRVFLEAVKHKMQWLSIHW